MSESTETITPEAFFEDVVPHIFKATREIRARAKYKGICEFVLFSSVKASWTLDLSEGTVNKDSVATPDLYMEMRREDFASMLADELDVSAAMEDGRLRMQGQVPLLKALSVLLRPRPASMPY